MKKLEKLLFQQIKVTFHRKMNADSHDYPSCNVQQSINKLVSQLVNQQNNQVAIYTDT